MHTSRDTADNLFLFVFIRQKKNSCGSDEVLTWSFTLTASMFITLFWKTKPEGSVVDMSTAPDNVSYFSINVHYFYWPRKYWHFWSLSFELQRISVFFIKSSEDPQRTHLLFCNKTTQLTSKTKLFNSFQPEEFRGTWLLFTLVGESLTSTGRDDNTANTRVEWPNKSLVACDLIWRLSAWKMNVGKLL